MASFYSAWLIGSIVLPRQDFTVNGVLVTVAAGTYYLTDATSALSLVAQVQAAVLPQAAGASVVLLGSGLVRMAAAGAFSVTWGAATALRDLLGYTGNLAASTSYTAPGKSALYFSPGKPATFALTPLGVTGAARYILAQSMSAYSGKAESTSHGARSYQRFAFEKVDFERVLTTGALGGEYGTWYALVAARSARWKLYRDAVEDAASTTAFTYDTVHGPYVLPIERAAEWAYQRSAGHTYTDYTVDLTVAATVCPEIS